VRVAGVQQDGKKEKNQGDFHLVNKKKKRPGMWVKERYEKRGEGATYSEK